MYIVFEGVDMLGKSTQIELLKSEFKDAVFTKEPGGTKLGESLRDIVLNQKISAKARLMLFLADRAEHYEEILSKNKFVISDRSFISGIAYDMDKFNTEFLVNLNKFILNSLKPDKILFFKGNKNLISQRLKTKKLDEIEKKGVEYFLKVQENMEFLINSLNSQTLTIDASLSIEEINLQIKGFLNDTSN